MTTGRRAGEKGGVDVPHKCKCRVVLRDAHGRKGAPTKDGAEAEGKWDTSWWGGNSPCGHGLGRDDEHCGRKLGGGRAALLLDMSCVWAKI